LRYDSEKVSPTLWQQKFVFVLLLGSVYRFPEQLLLPALSTAHGINPNFRPNYPTHQAFLSYEIILLNIVIFNKFQFSTLLTFDRLKKILLFF
jgi:hypothetical protein